MYKRQAKDTKAKLDGKTIVVKIKAGKDGKTFGSITGKEIAKAIKDNMKLDVDKKKITMEPIKTIGEHNVVIKLHKEVSAEVTVKVEEA